MNAQFDDRQRRDIVTYALNIGLTRAEVAAEYGIAVATLNRWIKMFRHEAVVVPPLETSEEEIYRLRREIRDLREQNAFLERIARHFAARVV